MRVNITVVTYNRLALTRRCLDSLLGLTEGKFGVNVVDNASTDGTLEYLAGRARADTRLRVHRLARNMGVSVAANVGWSAVDAPFYVKLDNDVEILRPDWLRTLTDIAARNPEAGMVGYRFLQRHDVRPTVLSGGSPFWEYGTCGGACVLVPRSVHARLGFWNEDYGKYGFEDLEYGERCRLAGLKTGYAPHEGMVRHLGYERDIQASYERDKSAGLSSRLSGEHVYFLNKLLFEHGVRPLYVARRFLPLSPRQPLRFGPNPEYRAILHLQRRLRTTLGYNKQGDSVVVDFSLWKTR